MELLDTMIPQLFRVQEAAPGGFFSLVPLVVFFPLLGLLTNLLIGRRIPERAVGVIGSTASGLAFVVAVLQAVALVGHPEGTDVHLLNWITIGDLSVPWAFRVDTLSVTMMLVVSGVGTLIHIYAIGYMHEDVRHHEDPKSFVRFFIYFNLFIFMMMILVTGNNYLMLFVGWEGVGLSSYLLIGFWFWKGEGGIGNAVAAKKAFVVNRIGDFGILIAMFFMFWAFRTFQFDQVFAQVGEAAPGVILAITLFMLLGVAGKSAQLPLFVWLPDAMAGPTPVSALIHAATMVTAGVYLVARSYPLYEAAPQAQAWVSMVGAVTALFAATIAMAQFDIKKVLAYSTVSQLGFMVAAVGMGGAAFVAGMFHLVTHAFFKALLFLSAGSVIHGVEHGEQHVAHDPRLKKTLPHGHHFDVQDMRNMGGLKNRMPVTFIVYLIGAAALAGFPFITAGFWSKDEILAEALHLNQAVFYLLAFSAVLTAFYSFRQVYLVFYGEARSTPAAHATESPPVMTVPLMILAVLSVIGGFMNTPFWHGFGNWLERTIHLEEHAAGAEGTAGATAEAAEASFLGFDPIAVTVSVVAVAIGISLAWYVYRRVYVSQQSLPRLKRPDDPLRGYLNGVFTGMERKWWVDELYQAVIVSPYIAISRFLADKVDWDFWHDWFHDVVIVGGFNKITYFLAEPVDQGIIDRLANSLAAMVRGVSGSVRNIQTGYARNYALSIFIGVVVIIGYLIFR